MWIVWIIICTCHKMVDKKVKINSLIRKSSQNMEFKIRFKEDIVLYFVYINKNIENLV